MAGPVTNLRPLVNANFRTSKRADSINDLMKAKLGLHNNYEPAAWPSPTRWPFRNRLLHCRTMTPTTRAKLSRAARSSVTRSCRSGFP